MPSFYTERGACQVLWDQASSLRSRYGLTAGDALPICESQPSQGEGNPRRGLLLPPSRLDGEGEEEGGTLARL